MTLTPFTRQYVDTYELASKRVLDSPRGPVVFGTQLYTVAFDDSEMVVDTVPVVLNLHLCNRLYRYERGGVTIETEPGDVVIDCGVGWGDTCVFMAARAHEGEGAAYYAFEIMEEGLESLQRQF